MQATVRTTTADTLSSLRDAVDLIYDKLMRWLAICVAKLPNLLVAVLVALLFWLLANVVRNGLSRALNRTPLAIPIRGLMVNIAAFAVLVAGLFIALGVLGLDKTVTSLLAGVGIVGLALGFAFQDIAANFMAGIILSVRQPFSIGHVIRTNDFTGTVTDITLRNTMMRQFTGELVLLPNKEVLGNPLINFSATGERRVDLPVGVSYGDDLEQVRTVAVAAVEGIEARRQDRPVELFYTEFGDSSINFTIRFWVDYSRQPDFLAARSEAVMAIKRAFDDRNITIPFPIRTLDFAPVGGVTLPDALQPVVSASRGRGAGDR